MMLAGLASVVVKRVRTELDLLCAALVLLAGYLWLGQLYLLWLIASGRHDGGPQLFALLGLPLTLAVTAPMILALRSRRRGESGHAAAVTSVGTRPCHGPHRARRRVRIRVDQLTRVSTTPIGQRDVLIRSSSASRASSEIVLPSLAATSAARSRTAGATRKAI